MTFPFAPLQTRSDGHSVVRVARNTNDGVVGGTRSGRRHGISPGGGHDDRDLSLLRREEEGKVELEQFRSLAGPADRTEQQQRPAASSLSSLPHSTGVARARLLEEAAEELLRGADWG